jgi:hypothetical protein
MLVTPSLLFLLIALFGVVNLTLFTALWLSNNLKLKGIEYRIEQLERDRQDTRNDIKNLTLELHGLVVELARTNTTKPAE